MSNGKVTIPSEIRWAVWERDNFTCQRCGTRRNLSIDHLVPVTKGGLTEEDNLQTLCCSCNSAKGNRLVLLEGIVHKEPKTLLEELMIKQSDSSDYAYAELLGVSQQLWQMTRSGKREVGITLLKAIAKVHPELASDVLIFLGFDVSMLTATTNNITTPSQSYQDSKSIRFKTWWDGVVLRAKKIRHNSHEP